MENAGGSEVKLDTRIGNFLCELRQIRRKSYLIRLFRAKRT